MFTRVFPQRDMSDGTNVDIFHLTTPKHRGRKGILSAVSEGHVHIEHHAQLLRRQFVPPDSPLVATECLLRSVPFTQAQINAFVVGFLLDTRYVIKVVSVPEPSGLSCCDHILWAYLCSRMLFGDLA